MKHSMSFLAIAMVLIMGSVSVHAQQPEKPRPSPKASVSQRIGIATDIKIEYGRPGVKGRKIWGELVPYGLAPGNKSSNGKPFPWRGGANENTTIEFTGDVAIDGNKLPAGKYSMHFIPSPTTWIVIFSKNDSLWGSYKYNQDEDALRITVTPVQAPFQEWLAYGFDELMPQSAVASLHWAELKIPFKIETAMK
jgi:Protein of unknown function (DUF2911)